MSEKSFNKENYLDETPLKTPEFSSDPNSPIFPFPQAKSTELISRKRPPLAEKENNDQNSPSKSLTGEKNNLFIYNLSLNLIVSDLLNLIEIILTILINLFNNLLIHYFYKFSLS